MTDERIHILAVARWPVGGIRTFFRYVYTKFVSNMFRFTFILPELSEYQAIIEDLQSLNASFVKLAPNPEFKDFLKAIREVHRKDKIDLIHSHGITVGLYSVLPSKLFRIPHLMTVHETFTEKQFPGLKGTFKKMILTGALKFIDCIHCVSDDARNNMLEFLPGLESRSDRIISIRNGIDVERFLTEEKDDFRQELGLEGDTFLIGFFGRFMSPKGFRFLADAMGLLIKKRLPRKLVVVCFGWGGFVREEQEELKRKGIIGQFRFMPFRKNIAPAIRGLDVVAMPSLWEAYGLLAAEALVAGVPLIGTDCVGLREVLRNTPARVVPAGNAKALAEAIENEMRFPSTEKARRFRETAAQRFDVRSQAEKLLKIIEKMALLI